MKTVFLISILLFTSSLFAATQETDQAETNDTASVDDVASTSIPSPSTNLFTHEILTSFTSGGFFSSTPCKSCKTSTEMSLNVSYLYFLQGTSEDRLQIGAEAEISSISLNGNTNTYINLLGVGAYNLDTDFKQSVFIKAGVGIYTIQDAGTNTETKMGVFIASGKRFTMMFDHVTYSPEIRIIKKGNLDFGFEANLLNFSIYWN